MYPSDSTFINAYVQLLQTITDSYHYAASPPEIVNVCGGLTEEDSAPCHLVKKAVDVFADNARRQQQQQRRRRGSNSKRKAKARYIEIPRDLLTYPDDFGCLDHRNAKGQRKLARFLLPLIQELMDW